MVLFVLFGDVCSEHRPAHSHELHALCVLQPRLGHAWCGAVHGLHERLLQPLEIGLSAGCCWFHGVSK